MTDHLSDFLNHAADTYDNRRAAEDDAERLADIADDIVQFTEAMRAKFDKLDLSREVIGHRGMIRTYSRSRFMSDIVAEQLASALSDELLSDTAGAVLVAYVKEGVK